MSSHEGPSSHSIMQSRAPRSSLSKRIPATRWEEVRGTIRKLYIDEGRELKDLRDFMAEVHHFDATISQYTTKLKTWGLRKYANRDVWNGVNGALKRRRLDITEADVSHNGMRMTLKKLKKELPRYSRIVQHSTTNCEDHGYWARTPPGVTVEPILDQQIRTILSRKSLPRIVTIRLPWYDYTDTVIPRLNMSLRASSPCRQLSPPTSTINTNGGQLLPPFSDEVEICSPDPTALNPWVFSTEILGLQGDEIVILEQTGTGPRCSARGKFLLLSFRTSAELKKALRPFVIEREPDETKKATEALMNPVSTATMQILTSYFALGLSNGLVEEYEVDAFVRRLLDTQHGSLRPIFAQKFPSGKAIASRLLHAAIRENAIHFLSEALRCGADIESPSTGMSSFTLLQRALEHGRLEIAKMLLKEGASPDIATNESQIRKRNPYIMCCCTYYSHTFTGWRSSISLSARSRSCVDLIPELRSYKALVPRMCHVLIDAIRFGASLNTIQSLLEAKQDPNQITCQRKVAWTRHRLGKHNGTGTPLCVAAQRCSAEIVALLLDAGALPDGPLRADVSGLIADDQDLFGFSVDSPLLLAIDTTADVSEADRRSVVELLISHGANPNLSRLEFLPNAQEHVKSHTYQYWKDMHEYREGFAVGPYFQIHYPLQGACEGEEDLGVIESLLSAGAFLNPLYGAPPLTIAISNRRTQTARLLLDRGADPNGFDQHLGGPSALDIAIENADLDMVNLLIARGADLNMCPAVNAGRTPLQSAVEKGELGIVELLIAHGADINMCPPVLGGRTPLQRAAEIGNLVMVEHLLRLGASLISGVAPKFGISALQGFVEHGWHDYVARVLKEGASPNQCSVGGRTPLTAAVIRNDLKLLRLILYAGADTKHYSVGPWVHECSRNRDRSLSLSPIQWAANFNHVEAAKILVEAGADVNQEPCKDHGHTALHLAVLRGNYDIMRILVTNGASVHAYSHGKSVLELAVENGMADIIKFLLQHGAELLDVELVLNKRSLVETACLHGHLSVLETLLQANADMSFGNPILHALNGVPLHAGNEQNQIAIVDLLLTHGADINRRGDKDDTPLQYAIIQRMKCAYHLIEEGAHINAGPSTGDGGRTALQAATVAGEVDLVEHLLSKGADVNAPPSVHRGITALQGAAIMGYLRIAQILLDHGADIDAEASPRLGRTAIDGAAEWGRIDMVKLLLDNYDGPKPIAELVESARAAAKKGNQWYVMELLNSYRPPEEDTRGNENESGGLDFLEDQGWTEKQDFEVGHVYEEED